MRDVNHAHGLGMVSGESKRLLAYGEPDEGGDHHDTAWYQGAVLV